MRLLSNGVIATAQESILTNTYADYVSVGTVNFLQNS